MDAQIAAELNAQGLPNCRGGAFDHGTIHLLRQRWGVSDARTPHGHLARSARGRGMECVARVDVSFDR